MTSLQGTLLIASPQLPDPNFYRTVVLVLEHHEEGALGLVLNRPGNGTVRQTLESACGPSPQNDQALFVGGPVPGPLMVLHTHPQFSEQEVMPGIYFASRKEYVLGIVAHPGGQFRMFNGYSGWGQDQLEGELRGGGWLTLSARHDYIFGAVDDTLWTCAVREIGRDILSHVLKHTTGPSDPSCN